MKIHGSTDIILKSKYGRVDRYHSENTFQSAVLAEGLRNLGYAKASMYNSPDASNPPFSEIVGGILLLDKNDIPINSQFVPLGVKMTGNGAFGVTNSSAPNELGSYNSAESIITPSSITFVYDWTTSQANGTIGSVCLTSKTGGYIGIGNSISQTVSSTLYDMERNGGGADVCPQTSLNTYKANYNKIVCDGKQYSFVLNGTNLEITKFKLPLKKASVFDCIPQTIIKDVSGMNYTFMGGSYIVSASNKKIYLTPSGTIKSNPFYMWEFDTTDDTLTEKTYNFGFSTINVSVSQGKIFAPNNSSNTMGIFNLDGTSYDTVECGTFYTGQYSDYGAVVGDFGNHTLFNHRNNGDSTVIVYLYDSVLKKAYPINAKVFGFNRTQGVRQDESSKALMYTFYPSDTQTKAYNNPLYLATINNLNNPVTKNLTMAMKVLYKLEQS